MMSFRKELQKARLYLVLDTQVNGYSRLLTILRSAVAAGVDIVQLRDKGGTAKDILSFSRKAKKILNGRVPFIINDRVDLALAADADGVHLGQSDLPIALARHMLGRRRLICASCQTLAHVRRAREDGADYIGFGSVFKTLTKPDRQPMDLKRLILANQNAEMPVFAIGGINADNVRQLVSLGVRRVAVTRSVSLAADVGQTVAGMKRTLVADQRKL